MDDLGFDWEERAKKPSIPHFYGEAVESPFLSQQAGHAVFEDREFVRVIIPGDMRSTPVYEVTDEHKQRWPKAYAAFKAGQEPPTDGTPLTAWPPIGKARALTFAAMHIKTVEELAAVGDNLLDNLGMGARQLRQEARTFLDVAKNGTAPIARLVARAQSLEDAGADKDRIIAAKDARITELEAELAKKERSRAA